MISFSSLAVLSSIAVSQVAAHGGVLSYSWAGEWYWGWEPYDTPTGQTTIQRPWSSYNPITDATDSTLACNDDGTSGALQLTGTVAAGTAITAYWNQVWPHAYGPMLTYLAQCPGSSCTGADASSLQWFKIDEAGLLSGTVYDGYWGDGQMIAQNSSWTTTIPSTVPSGNYLIRFETIALHSMPAQFYPECAQIEITNGGSLAPTSTELVTFPGAYSNNDPGLNIDIYSNAAQSETTYVIPGPPLYGSASGSSGSAPPASAPASAPASPSSTAPAPSDPAAPGTGAAQYAQCGGTGFTGATTCVAPYTCQVVNAYYSQCL
ncbi:glycosyl hydrolase family 61-domain-containing protein [Phellopilus nigrolimitatus]|nr:glycosyl hydrolase family 61-domain-containing protein [Phellopilus nigrolimitatus]